MKDELTEEEIALIRKGSAILAVKSIRERLECDLNTAYKMVQEWCGTNQINVRTGKGVQTTARYLRPRDDGTFDMVEQVYDLSAALEGRKEIVRENVLGQFRYAKEGDESRTDGMSVLEPADFGTRRIVPIDG